MLLAHPRAPFEEDPTPPAADGGRILVPDLDVSLVCVGEGAAVLVALKPYSSRAGVLARMPTTTSSLPVREYDVGVAHFDRDGRWLPEGVTWYSTNLTDMPRAISLAPGASMLGLLSSQFAGYSHTTLAVWNTGTAPAPPASQRFPLFNGNRIAVGVGSTGYGRGTVTFSNRCGAAAPKLCLAIAPKCACPEERGQFISLATLVDVSRSPSAGSVLASVELPSSVHACMPHATQEGLFFVELKEWGDIVSRADDTTGFADDACVATVAYLKGATYPLAVTRIVFLYVTSPGDSWFSRALGQFYARRASANGAYTVHEPSVWTTSVHKGRNTRKLIDGLRCLTTAITPRYRDYKESVWARRCLMTEDGLHQVSSGRSELKFKGRVCRELCIRRLPRSSRGALGDATFMAASGAVYMRCLLQAARSLGAPLYRDVAVAAFAELCEERNSAQAVLAVPQAYRDAWRREALRASYAVYDMVSSAPCAWHSTLQEFFNAVRTALDAEDAAAAAAATEKAKETASGALPSAKRRKVSRK